MCQQELPEFYNCDDIASDQWLDYTMHAIKLMHTYVRICIVMHCCYCVHSKYTIEHQLSDSHRSAVFQKIVQIRKKLELEKTQLFDVMHDIQHKASSIISKNVSLWLGFLSLLQCSYVKEKK